MDNGLFFCREMRRCGDRRNVCPVAAEATVLLDADDMFCRLPYPREENASSPLLLVLLARLTVKSISAVLL